MDARARVRQLIAEAARQDVTGNVIHLHPPRRRSPAPRLLALLLLLTLAALAAADGGHHADQITADSFAQAEPTPPPKLTKEDYLFDPGCPHCQIDTTRELIF